MKRGQTGIGLVLLGIIAIIAVIGLVLLFTRASVPEGAVVNYGGYSQVAGGIGDSYGWALPGQGAGISPTRQTPQWLPSGSPTPQYPASISGSTYGARTPAFVLGGGYASIEDLYSCETDIIEAAKIGVPHDAFNCYTVPVKGGSGGFEPPASSAYSRGLTGKTGGNVNCYANSVSYIENEDLVRNNLLSQLVDQTINTKRHVWSETTINGKRVPVCWVSLQPDYVFPQGMSQ